MLPFARLEDVLAADNQKVVFNPSAFVCGDSSGLWAWELSVRGCFLFRDLSNGGLKRSSDDVSP